MDFIELLKSTELGRAVITFFVSMLPVLELRGAIPLGVGMGLPPLLSMAVSIIGNILPAPFIIIFIRRIFEWMRKKSVRLSHIVERLEAKAYRKKDFIYKWEVLGLIILVAIPLPGTGAWTGALVASIFDIRLRTAMPAIITGVIIAGIIITGLTVGFTKIF